MANEQQIRQINIRVVTSGEAKLRQIAKDLGGVNESVKSLKSGFLDIRNAFIAGFAALRVRDLAQISDSMQQLNDRVRLFIKPGEDAREVLGRIADVANRTKSSVETVGSAFTRFASVTGDLGLKTQDILDLTETLQNTFRISGASADETANATIQFSQALALGVLRGQDFKSVISQNAELGNLLAKGFGKSRSELQGLAEKGLLKASKVLEILFKNMDDTNKKAGELGQTFEQTLTVAMNNFKLAVLDVNKALDLSGGFAKAVDSTTKLLRNLKDVIGAELNVLITALGGKVENLVKFFANLLNLPFVSFFVDATDSGLGFGKMFDYVRDAAITAIQYLLKFGNVLLSVSQVFGDFETRFLGTSAVNTYFKGLEKSVDDFRISLESLKTSGEQYANSPLDPLGRKRVIPNIKDTGDKKEEKLKDILGDINKLYLNGAIDAEMYFSKFDAFQVEKLTREFRDGKIELDKYNDGFTKLRIQQVTRDFNSARISFREFNDQITKLRITQVTQDFEAGRITLEKYDEEINKLSNSFISNSILREGAQSYLNTIGTTAQNVAGLIKATFSSLEDSLVDFIKTGEFNFEKFTQAILDDLTRIIIRAAIIRPLAEGIIGLSFSPRGSETYQTQGSGGQLGVAAAHGAAFENGNLRRFAKGGIVSQPTLFSYGGGQKGLMGEAGSEAVLPLRRGPDGDLGVKASTAPVFINVENYGADVQTEETQGPDGSRFIKMIIRREVNESILDGSLDKSMQVAYNARRRGT